MGLMNNDYLFEIARQLARLSVQYQYGSSYGNGPMAYGFVKVLPNSSHGGGKQSEERT